jgi:pyridoxine 5-phosphate synthase
MATLGVNIDHIATLRQMRGTSYPDPVAAASIAELAGANGITVHLREDRRHIQDRDVRILRETVESKLNLEMSRARSIVRIACGIRPDQTTLVPEKREELTTEGGLDVFRQEKEVRKVVRDLQKQGIVVSLFVEPDPKQIEASHRTGAEFVEVHTGRYSEARTERSIQKELERIRTACGFALDLGLRINAGHGLHYWNTAPIAAIPGMEELNIGHSIIARAVLVGLDRAVRDMIDIIQNATSPR